MIIQKLLYPHSLVTVRKTAQAMIMQFSMDNIQEKVCLMTSYNKVRVIFITITLIHPEYKKYSSSESKMMILNAVFLDLVLFRVQIFSY